MITIPNTQFTPQEKEIIELLSQIPRSALSSSKADRIHARILEEMDMIADSQLDKPISLSFPLLVVLIVILGIILIWYVR